MAYPDLKGLSPTALKERCILSIEPVLQYRHPRPHFVPTFTANCARPFFSNSTVLEIPALNVAVWTLMAAGIMSLSSIQKAAAGSRSLHIG
jgi:hypothetical protein